jgi:hypothetical protein
MTNFDEAFANSLDQLAGGSSLEECLARYPEHAAQLRPLLRTAQRLERGQGLMPSPAAKARVRARVTSHMRAYPRRGQRGAMSFQRLMVSLAVVAIAFFVTGTAFAQNALPGDFLYGWKRTSERVWQIVSPDRLGTDLALSHRRAVEITRVTQDSNKSVEAVVEDYREVVMRLRAHEDSDSQARVYPMLQAEQDLLKSVGVSVPELDEYLKHAPASETTPSVPEIAPGLP